MVGTWGTGRGVVRRRDREDFETRDHGCKIGGQVVFLIDHAAF